MGATDDIEQPEVLESLLSLVDKSLVVAEPANDGRMRYRMLEPVRQYGLERLERSGEVEVVRRRHAEFFLALAEEAEPWLRGPEQASWFERLDAENDNLRAALSWLVEQGEGNWRCVSAGRWVNSGTCDIWRRDGGGWRQRWLEGMTHRRGSKHYCTLDGSPGNR